MSDARPTKQIRLVDEQMHPEILNTIFTEGPKGTPIVIYEKKDVYEYVTKVKDLKAHETKTNTWVIPRADVDQLWKILSEQPRGVKQGYGEIVRKIVVLNKLHTANNLQINQMVDAFNGGKNRAKWYFPRFYRPLKILEAQEKVKHGQGTVTRRI
jgi:hypothetical protein